MEPGRIHWAEQIARFVEEHPISRITGTNLRELEKELLALGLDVEFVNGPICEYLSVRAKEE